MTVSGQTAVLHETWPARCRARFWRLFPHLTLCCALVAYTMLGALVFMQVEGGRKSSTEQEYRNFLSSIVKMVQNDTNNKSCTLNQTVSKVVVKMQDFKSIWFQSPSRWNLFGSVFFCCSIFSTVGYGEIYPVTLLGKALCIIYAMVGIPLMLLVILDVGDFLALVMSKAYNRTRARARALFKTWSRWRTRRRRPWSNQRTLDDGTLLRQPLDIRQVLNTQADVRHKSIHLQNNKEIFEKLLARDNLMRKDPLLRSLSCPELEQMPQPPSEFAIWDFSGLGNVMEDFDVPFILILFIVFAYICFGGIILPLWEPQIEGFDSFYFCFITLTTIGFGDIIPKDSKCFWITSLFFVVGMSIMSMAFKLSQNRIVSFYRNCIRFIGRANAETTENVEKK
ncbi:potassium channel subfamily K member 18-like [Xiphophorus couchianus]|uniref:potassium channel subfamily K member 18-like n=1 Tax=Xiphophorus couchianus TaxID=32473 RepID=UPI00101674D9|nr:potassium channel subfamily K member 18-like [Xiphophorus couchianus]XP_027861964.1 potassium channel subfamily K member 18-like [Xiphophorus couchianus]